MAVLELNQSEFYDAITNLIAVVRVNNSLKFDNPFMSVHHRADVNYGDQLVFRTVDALEAIEYSAGDTVLTEHKPTLKEQAIGTSEKILFAVTNNEYIARGAFINSYSLGEFIAEITSMLQKSKEVYTYRKMIADFKTKATTLDGTQKIEVPIYQAEGTETPSELLAIRKLNAERVQQAVMDTANLFTRPSKDYNSIGFTMSSNVSDLVFYPTVSQNNALKINIDAALFNSGRIGRDQYVSDTIYIPDADAGENVIGLLMDRQAYVWFNRFEVGTSFFNARSLSNTNFLHMWAGHGFNDGQQLVVLVAKPGQV